MKTILVDAAKTFVITGEGIDIQMYQLLEQYPNRKIILTNANDEELITFGLVNLPYEMFTLKHNPNKTESTYFTKMLEHFNLNANDVVYFEHTKEAVESAETIGITSYHFDENVRDLENLKKFLDKNL